jgi:hypothetical protein
MAWCSVKAQGHLYFTILILSSGFPLWFLFNKMAAEPFCEQDLLCLVRDDDDDDDD